MLCSANNGHKKVLEPLLSELYSDLEIEKPCTKDGSGFFLLPILEDTSLRLKEEERYHLVAANILECPEKHRELLFTYLMKANFLGKSTAGAAIGLDAQEKFLTLSLTIPYDITYKAFKDTIEDFTNYLIYWREEIERHQMAADRGILQ